eukprot:m.785312 g.785312  ORF g.785312 m.785312 type:complete len:1490 (-) comp59163_c0_seq2:1347-5816(-)
MEPEEDQLQFIVVDDVPMHPTLDMFPDESDTEIGDCDDDVILPAAAIHQERADADPNASGRHRGHAARLVKGNMDVKLSNYLTSPAVLDSIGRITAFTTQVVFAVGTMSSQILIFSPTKDLVHTLSPGQNNIFGPVSCLALNHDGTRLVAGFDRGQVVRWDVPSGKVLNLVPDVYQGIPVLGVGFFDENTLFYSHDVEGRVHVHVAKTVLGIRMVDSKMVYQSYDDPISRIQSLSYIGSKQGSDDLANRPEGNTNIMAMASLSKMLIAQVTPECQIIITTHRRPDDGFMLPSLAWHFTEVAEDLDPVLAFSWGLNIRFAKLSFNRPTGNNKKVKVEGLEAFRVRVPIVHIGWINAVTLAVLDIQERMSIIDFNSLLLLDLVDVSPMHITRNFLYSAAQIQNGAHLPRLPSFDLGLEAVDSHIYVACASNEIHDLTLMDWEQRIASLVSQSKFPEALELAMAMFQDNAPAAYNLPEDPRKRRELIRSKMLTLLQAYIDISLASWTESAGTAATPQATGSVEAAPPLVLGVNPPTPIPARLHLPKSQSPALIRATPARASPLPPSAGGEALGAADINKSSTHAFSAQKELASLTIDSMMKLRSTKLLFTDMYDTMRTHTPLKACFLEQLEPLIMANRLLALPANILSDFVAHFVALNKLKVIEACLLKLDVSRIDKVQARLLCWKHAMYDAALYIYSQGCQDFITPLRTMLVLLKIAIKDFVIQFPFTRNDMCEVIAQPFREIGDKLLTYVRFCLTGRAYPSGKIPTELERQVQVEVYRFIIAREGDDPDDCPFIRPRAFVKYNTKAFLDVLALAFQVTDHLTHVPGVPTKQVVVDILQEVVLSREPCGRRSFSPEQVGCLFTFIARQMARFEGQISVDKRMFEQVLDYLTNPGDNTNHDERQQALLELLQAGMREFEEDQILRLSENAKFYRVCELVYRNQRKFPKVLHCYLKDRSRHSQVFVCLRDLIWSDELDNEERDDVFDAAIANIADLIYINHIEAARFVLLDLPSNMLQIILNSQQHNPKAQYFLFAGIFAVRDTLEIEPVEMTRDQYEQYFDLMCRIDGDAVLDYLRDSDDFTVLGLEACLALCRKYSIINAIAYLLEKMNEFGQAHTLLVSTTAARFGSMGQAYLQLEKVPFISRLPDTPVVVAKDKAVLQARNMLNDTIQLCLRGSIVRSEQERQALWAPLLSTVSELQAQIRSKIASTKEDFLSVTHEFTSIIVNRMLGYVPFPMVLSALLSDTSVTRKFSEVKDIILGMLDTFNYEETLLQTTTHILGGDLLNILRHREVEQKRAAVAATLLCEQCKRPANDVRSSSAGVILFHCGHAYHSQCIQCRNTKKFLAACPACKCARAHDASADDAACAAHDLEVCARMERELAGLESSLESKEDSATHPEQLEQLSAFKFEQASGFATHSKQSLFDILEASEDMAQHAELPTPPDAFMARPDFPLVLCAKALHQQEAPLAPILPGVLPHKAQIVCSINFILA